MSEVSFEQMLEESFKSIHNGEVVDGTVIDVKPDFAVLNIGYKNDAILNKKEYSAEDVEDLTAVINVGDSLEVKVLKLNDSEGQALVSHKRVLADKGNEILREAFENETVLTAKVDKVLNGGLSVVCEGTKIFIPASLVSDVFEKDLAKYNDTEIEFIITEFNPRRNRIIGSRRAIIAEQKKAAREELLSKVDVGDTLEGTVKNVTDFGAFVDIGGADGLLHISEMSWVRNVNPKDIVKVGDVVKVFIKDIKNDKIALSMKFPENNPWKILAEKYSVGSVISGKIARMADFGAFVEVEQGIDALLHVSQISYQHIDKPSDVLKVGDVVEAKVVDFNEADHKISISMKALQEPPVAEPKEEVAPEADAE